MQVKDVKTKGFACVDTKSSASDAAKKMEDQNAGTIMVNDKDQLVEVVSMADIAQEMRPCINSIFDDIAKAVK